VVILYRRFGTAYQAHLQGCSWNYWRLKTGLLRCTETSVKDYHYTVRNIPEESISCQHRGGRLKSRTFGLHKLRRIFFPRRGDVSFSWTTVLHGVSLPHASYVWNKALLHQTTAVDASSVCRCVRSQPPVPWPPLRYGACTRLHVASEHSSSCGIYIMPSIFRPVCRDLAELPDSSLSNRRCLLARPMHGSQVRCIVESITGSCFYCGISPMKC
jgi:hypothetical protein